MDEEKRFGLGLKPCPALCACGCHRVRANADAIIFEEDRDTLAWTKALVEQCYPVP